MAPVVLEGTTPVGWTAVVLAAGLVPEEVATAEEEEATAYEVATAELLLLLLLRGQSVKVEWH